MTDMTYARIHGNRYNPVVERLHACMRRSMDLRHMYVAEAAAATAAAAAVRMSQAVCGRGFCACDTRASFTPPCSALPWLWSAPPRVSSAACFPGNESVSLPSPTRKTRLGTHMHVLNRPGDRWEREMSAFETTHKCHHHRVTT